MDIASRRRGRLLRGRSRRNLRAHVAQLARRRQERAHFETIERELVLGMTPFCGIAHVAQPFPVPVLRSLPACGRVRAITSLARCVGPGGMSLPLTISRRECENGHSNASAAM